MIPTIRCLTCVLKKLSYKLTQKAKYKNVKWKQKDKSRKKKCPQKKKLKLIK